MAAIIVIVAVVGWLARSPATTPDQLAVDDPADQPSEVPEGARATEGPTEAAPDLLDLDDILPVGAGSWDLVPPAPPGRGPGLLTRPASAAGPATAPPTHVWDGDELVVLTGRDGVALDPTSDLWRTVPGYPGNPSGIKDATRLDRGVVVIDLLEGPEPGEASTGAVWRLGPDNRWEPLPRPPTGRITSLADHPEGMVATGRPSVQVASAAVTDGAWLLVDGATSWASLPPFPQALDGARAFATTAGLVVLGVVAPPELDRNVIGAGELGAAAYLLDPASRVWQPLADPPAVLATGSQAVATGVDGGRSEQIVLLEATDPGGVLRVHTYDVAADNWRALAIPLPARAAAAVGGAPLLGSDDGQGSAWFRWTNAEDVLLRIDAPSGAPFLVAPPPSGARDRTPVPFPGGLLLAGGVEDGAEGAPAWATRIDRWIPDTGPR